MVTTARFGDRFEDPPCLLTSRNLLVAGALMVGFRSKSQELIDRRYFADMEKRWILQPGIE
jgi:hypothetical protein